MRTLRTTSLSLLLLGACGRETPPGGERQAGEDTLAVHDTTSTSVVDIAWRHFSQVPDSALLRRGACPFECCVYGDWRATTDIPVQERPARDASRAFTLARGARFKADSGHVKVTGAGIVVVYDTVPAAGGNPQFLPGDTLVVLDYVGEGHWHAWLRARIIGPIGGFWGAEVDSPRGAYYGDYRKEWWVHATDPQGRSGWFRADSTYRFSGADACAGPVE